MAMIAIGAAAAVAGAAAGVYSSNQAAATGARSNAIAEKNYALQREIANTQEEMAKAGSIDAAGNATQYVPGVGWVSTPTAQSRNIINADLNEQQIALSHDAQQNRMQRDNTFNRGLRAGAAGDAILGGIDEGKQSSDDIRGLLTERNVARAMSGKNAAESRIGMASLRQGTGSQYIMSQLARDGMADTRTAIAEANADTAPEFLARKSARTNPVINQFTSLSDKANAAAGAPVARSGLRDDLATQLATRQNGAVSGLNSAMGLKAPQLQSPTNNTPQAIGNLGAAGQGLWSAIAARRASDAASYTGSGYNGTTGSFEMPGTDYSMTASGGGTLF